jgi:hypothetical protein
MPLPVDGALEEKDRQIAELSERIKALERPENEG